MMKRDDSKMHTMIRVGAGEGTEEWYCPNCGRHMLLNWGPEFEKVILEVGDPDAVHSGNLDDSQAAQVNFVPADDRILPELPDTTMEDTWLLPWMKWFDNVGFDRFWDQDL